MRLTNTLSGHLDLVDDADGHVGIYVCGVTPYDVAHVGHAMSLIVYDVLVRYLRWSGNPRGGLRVTYVSNYTDVDDKLIERGAALERDPIELAHANIEAWEHEQRALGLLEPDVRPRVTREIPAIIATIEAIVRHDLAYATAAGDVYFRVRAKPDYGKLSHRNIDDLRSGTRFEPGEGKEFALDFALWKAAKPGEPSWDSPWGKGRPGWHIECTTMAQRYLGTTFDIHGGGVDLIFPHHENEIAQAEAASDEPFARIWMHNGMVQRDGEKMSKSLGNVVTVSEALERWTPDAIRLYVLNSQYRSPNNLTDDAMGAATRAVERLTEAAHRAIIGDAHADVRAIPGKGMRRSDFVDAMEDDLSTPRALAVLFSLASAINHSIDAEQNVDNIRTMQAELRELAAVLGLRLGGTPELDPADVAELMVGILSLIEDLREERPDLISALPPDPESPRAWPRAMQPVDRGRGTFILGGGRSVDLEDIHKVIVVLIEARDEARLNKNYATADLIRSRLLGLGIELADSARRTEFKIRFRRASRGEPQERPIR